MKQETDYIYSIPKFAGKSTPDNTLELLRRIGFREELNGLRKVYYIVSEVNC